MKEVEQRLYWLKVTATDVDLKNSFDIVIGSRNLESEARFDDI